MLLLALPRRTFRLCLFSRLQPTLRPASVHNCRAQDRSVGWRAWSYPGLREISSVAPNQNAPPEVKAPKSSSKNPRILSGLDPNALKVEEFVDISGFQRSGREGRFVPFPPGTRGFFYFRRSPHEHAAAGEIRFRVFRDEDAPLPVSEPFALGSDLISPDGITPWRIHVLHVFQSYPGIRAQLVAEGHVSGAQADQIDAILASGVKPERARILENIADPFIWSLRSDRPALMVLDREGVFAGGLKIHTATPGRTRGRTGSRSGRALVRFELAKVEPDGEPKVVIRVLKIIEPPKPEDAEIANEIFREGELVHKYNIVTRRRMGPWSTTRSAEDRLITPSSRKVLEEIYLPKPAAP